MADKEGKAAPPPQEEQDSAKKRQTPSPTTAWDILDEYRGPFGAVRTRAADRALEQLKQDRQEGEEDGKERPQLDSIDILAFIIAFFQLLLPPFLIMAAVLFLLYLLFRLWAGV